MSRAEHCSWVLRFVGQPSVPMVPHAVNPLPLGALIVTGDLGPSASGGWLGIDISPGQRSAYAFPFPGPI